MRLDDALRDVLLPLARARPLPAWTYRDPDLLAREWSRLFVGGGFAAASRDDVALPGQWARVPAYDDQLVVARDADLALALLRDACRHRGAALFDGDGGRLGALSVTCPYHAWRYALSGGLLDAPGACADVDRGAQGLRAGEAWEEGPVVFAGGGPRGRWRAVPWLASLGPLRRARRAAWDVAADWKLVVENFQESHHFPSVHPWLEARTPWRRSRSVSGDAWLGGEMRLADDVDTVSTTGRIGDRARIAEAGVVRDAWVAPNLLTSLQPDYLLVYRLHPVAVGATRVVCDTWVHPSSPAAQLDEVFAFWDRTHAEDRAVCERQQRGLASRWPGGVYCESEDGVHAFDAWYARAMRGAEGP